MSSKHVFADATLSDIVANPKKYGAPTFEEYSRDPSAYRMDWAAVADNGSRLLSKNQVKQKYKIFGYVVDTIEEADVIASDKGFVLSEMTIHPELRDQGGQKYDVEVEFRPKVVISE